MGKNVSDGDVPPQNTTQGGLYYQILPPTPPIKVASSRKRKYSGANCGGTNATPRTTTTVQLHLEKKGIWMKGIRAVSHRIDIE
jgi:hypothetical protein